MTPPLRVEDLLRTHYAFVWRCVRRFGVLEANVDDVVQEVFIIASRKLDQIEPGKERAFLTSTGLHLALNLRRATRRRPTSCEQAVVDAAVTEEHLSPDVLVDQRRARQLLDEVLDALPMKLRAPFALAELEGLSRTEIAEILNLPVGTIATRIRSARRLFDKEVQERFGTPPQRQESKP